MENFDEDAFKKMESMLDGMGESNPMEGLIKHMLMDSNDRLKESEEMDISILRMMRSILCTNLKEEFTRLTGFDSEYHKEVEEEMKSTLELAISISKLIECFQKERLREDGA